MTPTHRAVVVTGVGAVTPLGADVPSFWSACLAGRSGVRSLQAPWLERGGLRTRIGAPAVAFDPGRLGLTAKDLRTLDPASRLALAATHEALVSARLGVRPLPDGGSRFEVGGLDPARCATRIGSGVGGLTTFEASHRRWVEAGTFRGSGFLRMALPMLIPNAPAAEVAIRFGLRGECSAVPTACAAGAMSIGDAWRIVAWGDADVAVAGGADSVLSDHDGLGLAGFDNLRVLSTRNDEPERASRPFDRGRDGFVLGDGAAVLVLEAEEHARARGAPVLARLLGYGATCDAHSMMQPAPDGSSASRAFAVALRAAGLAPQDVGYVNAHATGTPAGDRVEAAVLRRVFGAAQPAVSATKSMTGHCIGGSGAIEVVATILSLRDGIVPPTINLDDPDPECDLDHVVGGPRRIDLRIAASASYGFGGHDAVLVLSRP